MISRCFMVCAAFVFGAVLNTSAGAQSYPSGPVTFLVPYAAGGSADIAARLVGAALQQRLGKPVVIENRPGGSELVVTDALARSAPDGLTIAILSNAAAINQTLVTNRRTDIERDLSAVAKLIEIPFAIMVHPSVPARTIKELVAHSKDNPKKLAYGHLGPGSPHYFVMEWFKQAAGIDLLAVPYRGAAPAYTALIAGEVQVVASGLGPATQILENKQARALAAVSSTRPVSRPDLPTLSESGYPDFDLNSWMGVFVKSGTPPEIVEKLQHDILAALSGADVSQRLTKIGLQPTPLRAAEFATFVSGSVTAWGRIVKSTGAKSE